MIKTKIGISAIFTAILLLSLTIVPAFGASDSDGKAVSQKVNYTKDGIVTPMSTVYQASLSVSPYKGAKGSTFYFKGSGTYTLEVYGIPLPDLLWFANDINYKGFNKPSLLSASDPSEYYYTTSTTFSEGAWTQRYFMSMLGGPTTKSVYCKAVSRNKGTFGNRQYAGLTLIGGSNKYVYTTVT